MDPKTITPEEARNRAAQIIQTAEKTRQTMLKDLITSRQSEAARLRLQKAELLKTTGPDDPRVKALDRRVIGTERVIDFAETSLRTVERGRAVKPTDLVFTGRVVDAKGRPLAGLRVELVDAQGRFKDRFGALTTDSNGEFFVRHAAKDIADVIAEKPKLTFRVLDKDGKEVYRAAQAIEPKLGQVTGFDVRIRRAPGRTLGPPVVGPSIKPSRGVTPKDEAAADLSPGVKDKTPRKKALRRTKKKP